MNLHIQKRKVKMIKILRIFACFVEPEFACDVVDKRADVDIG